jgi:hypothetical protein
MNLNEERINKINDKNSQTRGKKMKCNRALRQQLDKMVSTLCIRYRSVYLLLHHKARYIGEAVAQKETGKIRRKK